MEHDHMIEAFATNAANHPLDIGSLPRRAWCRQDFANAHVSHVFSEVIAKDRIAVAQEVARELGKGKCIAQLPPEARAVEPPEQGCVVAIPQVGGLHHRYQRRAA